jgi:hypothetical protein
MSVTKRFCVGQGHETFCEDARNVLTVSTWPQHSFLTAGVPVLPMRHLANQEVRLGDCCMVAV